MDAMSATKLPDLEGIPAGDTMPDLPQTTRLESALLSSHENQVTGGSEEELLTDLPMASVCRYLLCCPQLLTLVVLFTIP